MKIIETIIEELSKTESLVSMVIADNKIIDDAEEVISFTVRVQHREVPLLAEVQEEALDRAKFVIAEERKPLLSLSKQAR